MLSDRKKILFLGDGRSPHLKRWLSSFSKRGHEVHLGTIYPEANSERNNGILVHDISSKGAFPKLAFLRILRNTFALIRNIQPCLLHAHYINSYGWLGALTRFHPFILTVWGGDVLVEQGAFKKMGSKYLTKLAIQKADAITADAPNLIDVCASFREERSSIHHVTFGIDLNLFKEKTDSLFFKNKFNIPTDSFVVFCPRRIDRLMNIDTIFKSIPKVVKSVPKSTFLVKIYPGQIDENYFKEIQQISNNLGIDKYIRFIDDPCDDVMRACYHIANVVVSIPTSDGMPATIFEAMASRTPLIVSDLPAYDGVVINRESGIRVPHRDKERLGEAIIELLTNKIKSNYLVENAIKIVEEKGDLEKEIDKVENLYRKLVQRGGKKSSG